MLANQVHLPEVAKTQKDTQNTENKGVEARESELDFEQLVQSKQRQQQEQQQRQNDAIERQQQNKQAVENEQQGQAEAQRKQERNQERNQDSAANKRRRDDVSASNDKQSAKTKEPASENISEDEAVEVADKTNSEADNASATEKRANSKESETEVQTNSKSAQTVETIKDETANSETSQWLDTILQIASNNSEKPTTDDVKLQNVENLTGLELTSEDLAQIKQILNQLDIELPDSLNIEQGQTISLEQLTDALTAEELEQFTAQLKAHLEQNSAQSAGVSEFLNNLMTDTKASNSDSDKTNTLTQLLQQLQSMQATQSNKTKEAIKATDSDGANKGPLQLTSLLNTLRQTAQKAEQQSEVTADTTEQVGEEDGTVDAAKLGAEKSDAKPININAPTTKVIDFGAAATASGSNINASMSQDSNNASLIGIKPGVVTENQVTGEIKPNAEANLKELAEVKPSTLFSELLESKTSDMENRSAKVNVAGVTLDKTLQMPKIENLSQAKNEVVVRENILFNKQELANQMQTQVGLMMARNMKSVDIRLDPPELGSMQVRLSVQNDQASVSFVVSNNQAKDALEQSLPKLKEMLEQQGMELADSDVQHGDGQRQEQAEEEGVKANGLSANGETVEDDLEHQQQRINQQINSPWNVSYYA